MAEERRWAREFLKWENEMLEERVATMEGGVEGEREA